MSSIHKNNTAMSKYIFLDFDGVLNTEYWQNHLIAEGLPWSDKHGAVFDPEAVRQLKRIVDSTGADIIVESSWKFLGLNAMQEMWTARQLPGKLIDITPKTINDRLLQSADIEPWTSGWKGLEIASWLIENAESDAPYVILDDELVALDSQLPHLVITNPHDGITEDIADRAIGILNNTL